jgi:multidrug resistance efflux pump
VKAPSSGYVHGLQVTVGEQVSDGSVLFNVKVSQLPMLFFTLAMSCIY